MILLAPFESDTLEIEKGMFISSEMAQALSEEMKNGQLRFNARFVPVHLPYKGLLTMDLGEHNHLRVAPETWEAMNLPVQYNGESLKGKKLIVFPMHGLGDQLYLAAAIRYLSTLYPGMEVSVVKSSIASAEQWYPYIYYDSFFNLAGPVVNTKVMASYDYYLNGEHFAHVDDYKGSYPPVFYLHYFFKHAKPAGVPLNPAIGGFNPGQSPQSARIAEFVRNLRKDGRPLLFLSSVSTGRVRDLPLKTVIRFIECIQDRYAVLVSDFKRPDIHEAVSGMNLSWVRSTDTLISHVLDLMEIIHLSDAVITSDSGITHLSECLKTPCGTVFNVVSPDERTGPYRYSESLFAEFGLDGVCRTPCYVHALKDGDVCPGMKHINDMMGSREFYDYPPCLDGLDGSHLEQLLNALSEKYGRR